MQKEYDLKKLRRRNASSSSDSSATKIAISLRLDGSVLAEIKTEALRMGIPYQTLIGSILHRYVNDEWVDRKTLQLIKSLKKSKL